MLKYRGGEQVGKGSYWNLSNGHRIDIVDKGILPEDNKSLFIRLPSFVMLLLGAILGLLYAIFLPFLALPIMVIIVGKKILVGSFHSARDFVSFGWRPTEAYLAGKKKEKKKDLPESSNPI